MRLLAVVGALSICIAACGVNDDATSSAAPPTPAASTPAASTQAPATKEAATTTTTIAVPADKIRVEIAAGCPASVAGHGQSNSTGALWVWNPDTSGLSDTFVPGVPTSAIVCHYSPLTLPSDPNLPHVETGGNLTAEDRLDAAEAGDVATLANGIEPSDIASTCLISTMDTATYTALVFAVPGRSDVDVWLKDWIGCPELTNGVRDSGELINGLGTAFLDRVDPDAPR
ncbi:MAG: hypothetical protein JWN99_2423 [Ilumatobacteraceae bacterium]|nr:hypothetical protein [Ilumatobacteraceae bacterium]